MVSFLRLVHHRIDLGSKDAVRLATYEGLTKLSDLDTVGTGVDEVRITTDSALIPVTCAGDGPGAERVAADGRRRTGPRLTIVAP